MPDIVDDVTSKRNDIRRLAYFSVLTYIELSKTKFISKAISLKNSFLIFYDVNLIVLKLKCFTKVSYLEGIR